MIVKRQQPEIAPTAVTRAELRESLIELWAQVFERELRADLAAQAQASGEAARLRAIEGAEPSHQLARPVERVPEENRKADRLRQGGRP